MRVVALRIPHDRRRLSALIVSFVWLLGLAQTSLAQAFRITGTTVSATGDTPIARAHLTAAPDHPCSHSSAPADAFSDPEGHFVLTLPCAGIWRLTAEAPNFPAQSFEQHDEYSTGIVLTSAQPTHDLIFRLTPNASINGVILDEAGEPVRDAKVALLTARPEPRPQASTTSDDRGFYEFPNLLPGFYQIAVQAQPWYASAATAGRRGAAQPSNQPTPQDPSLDLTYPLTFFPGVSDPASATDIHLTGGASQQADLRLSPIPSIHLIVPNAASPNADHTEGRPVNRRPFNVPAIMQVSAIGLTDFHPTSINVTEDGSLDLGGFAPGAYTLINPRSRDSGQEQFLEIQKDAPASVPLKSALDAAHPPAEPPQPGNLTLTGSVLFATQPSQGALLLLVPANPADVAQRRQSNTDGSFTFAHLNPGKYILVAVDHGWSLDLHAPAALNPYLLGGVPINLTASLTLKQPIQAQQASP